MFAPLYTSRSERRPSLLLLATGAEPTASKNQMMNDMFTDNVNLKERYEACSYGQLTIEPADVGGGVVDVQISANPNQGRSTLQNQAYAAVNSQYGLSNFGKNAGVWQSGALFAAPCIKVWFFSQI